MKRFMVLMLTLVLIASALPALAGGETVEMMFEDETYKLSFVSVAVAFFKRSKACKHLLCFRLVCAAEEGCMDQKRIIHNISLRVVKTTYLPERL